MMAIVTPLMPAEAGIQFYGKALGPCGSLSPTPIGGGDERTAEGFR